MKITDWEKFYENYDKVLTVAEKEALFRELNEEDTQIEELSMVEISW